MQHRDTITGTRLVVRLGERVLRSVPIAKERLTIGRRPYHDVPLDDLTVSGEHAVIHTRGIESVIHDLKSRNGTLVNGDPVMQRPLAHGDVIEIGIYRLTFVLDALARDWGSVGPRGDDPALAAEAFDPAFEVAFDVEASVEYLNGPLAGTVLELSRPVNSLSRGGTQMAVVTRRPDGWFITHLEGLSLPLINGSVIGLGPHALRDGDLIELAGLLIRFRLHD